MFGGALFGFAPFSVPGGRSHDIEQPVARWFGRGPGRAITGWVNGVRRSWREARRRRRSRACLARLDGHLLKDIGVSRADAEAEMNKPFWKA